MNPYPRSYEFFHCALRSTYRARMSVHDMPSGLDCNTEEPHQMCSWGGQHRELGCHHSCLRESSYIQTVGSTEYYEYHTVVPRHAYTTQGRGGLSLSLFGSPEATETRRLWGVSSVRIPRGLIGRYTPEFYVIWFGFRFIVHSSNRDRMQGKIRPKEEEKDCLSGVPPNPLPNEAE